MRFLCCFVLLAVLAPGAVAGDYGTLKATYAGQAAGHSKGNGGRFDWTNVSQPDLTGWDPAWKLNLVAGTLYTFCIELQQNIASGATTYDVNALTNAPKPGAGSTMSATQASNLEILMDHFFQSASTAGVDGVAKAAAFQLAVWEVVFGDYDAVNTILAGPSGYNATDRSNADALLAQLPARGGTLSDIPTLKSLALVSSNPNGRQDQIFQVAVPELASLSVWSVLACAVGGIFRRRRVG
ncbi:MAG: hypothetical protein AB7G28_09815 [Pirellulales bacterium]